MRHNLRDPIAHRAMDAAYAVRRSTETGRS